MHLERYDLLTQLYMQHWILVCIAALGITSQTIVSAKHPRIAKDRRRWLVPNICARGCMDGALMQGPVSDLLPDAGRR
ncbi:hypothetical protein DL95DRAFT_387307, partial [Leptodontidium sp. 2 PMI_412]